MRKILCVVSDREEALGGGGVVACPFKNIWGKGYFVRLCCYSNTTALLLFIWTEQGVGERIARWGKK